MRRLLRVIAVVGVVARLALAAWEDTREPGPLALGPALAVTAAALVAIALLLRREVRAAIQHADVLVPIALALIVEGFLSQLAAIWPSIDEGFVLGPRAGGHTVTVALVVVAAAWVLSAAWTTLLVLDVVAGRAVDLLGAGRRVPGALPRTFLVMAIGVGGADVIFWAAASQGELGPPVLPFAVALVALATIAWNVATIAWLPAVLERGAPLRATILTIRRASRAPWQHRRAWGIPLVIQLGVLGLVVWAPATLRSGVAWVGAYHEQSTWIVVHAEVNREATSAALWLLSRLACLLLALTIKLRVAGGLSGAARAAGSSRRSTARLS